MQNYNIAVREWNDRIIFLRKIVPGTADKSYGIQVARLAGLPGEIIQRAKDILDHLEKNNTARPKKGSTRAKPAPAEEAPTPAASEKPAADEKKTAKAKKVATKGDKKDGSDDPMPDSQSPQLLLFE